MLKAVSLFTVLVALNIQAAKAADPDHGYTLAQRWCAACHVIAKEGSQVADMPPSFASIARRDGFDVNRLAFFLLDPHPVMPNMGLSRTEATDLAAYIASLRN